LPKVHVNAKFLTLRKKIHAAHFNHVNTVSSKIDSDRRLLALSWVERLRMIVKDCLYYIVGVWPGNFEHWIEAEQQQLLSETNYLEYLSLLDDIKPDFLFSVTPYFLEEEFLIM